MENKTLSCLYSKIFRNCASPYAILVYIIYILIPTSNHNRRWCYFWNFALYIFWFLHQTTTSLLLVKTCRCCISFDSYIKPQLLDGSTDHHTVVYLLIPTSNHNWRTKARLWYWLYIFWFLHQTTTAIIALNSSGCCISFDSYIKPQLIGVMINFILVVYLLIPTSNHNIRRYEERLVSLYIFWFLHQTTTEDSVTGNASGCISFDSYIKPQPCRWCRKDRKVVYLLIPTSNHNYTWKQATQLFVVYLLIPTSNHNYYAQILAKEMLYIFWFLHQTTTCFRFSSKVPRLYIFWFLHQTTTTVLSVLKIISCISFDSYIKPQLPYTN